MARPHYELVTVQTALNRVRGMPFVWSLNPYRGCSHGCQYCYARATHAYFDLGLGWDFERIIFIKTNLPEVLRAEVRRLTGRGESIAIGTATDPYQPAEGQFRLTRRCLEVLALAAIPAGLTTKGTLVLRDLDVLQDLVRRTAFAVHISLITLDRDLWRRVEPGTPPPAQRLRAIERLRAAGIPVSVFLAPILPGLTDRPESLAAVIRAAAAHGASGVWPGVLRLGPGVKEWFLAFLGREFPHLLASYRRGYATGANAPQAYQERLGQRLERLLAQVTFPPPPPVATDPPARQLALPLG